MPLRLTMISLAGLLLLTACGSSPEATFSRGCDAMMKRQDGVNDEERKTFCTCLSDGTSALSDGDRKTLGILMKEGKADEDIRIGLQGASDEGELSVTGAGIFLQKSMNCSLTMVL